MAITEFLSRLFKVRKAETAGLPPPIFPTPPISATNGEYALRIDTVYACVSLYSDVISSLPKCIKKRGTHEEVPDHPASKLLNEAPNEFMDAPAFWSYLVHSMLLTGNAYARMEDTATGRRIIPLNPLSIYDITLDENYQKLYQIDDKVFTDDVILHFPGETMRVDGLRGETVIGKYALQTLQHAQQVERYANEQFRKGTNLSGVLEVPEALGPDEKNRLIEDLKVFHSGYETGGGILIADAGKKLSPISITPNDEAFIRSENFSVERICRWFRVPLHLVQNGNQQSYNSNEASYSTWTTTGLMPKLNRLATQINRKLLGDEYYLEFDLDELLKANLLDRYNAFNKACGRPWATVNEIRNEECLPPIDGGDELFIPGNISNPNGLMNNGGDSSGVKTN